MKVVRRGKRGRCEEGGEGTLVLSVHHPQPSVREAAVRQLGKLLRHKSKVQHLVPCTSDNIVATT